MVLVNETKLCTVICNTVIKYNIHDNEVIIDLKRHCQPTVMVKQTNLKF